MARTIGMVTDAIWHNADDDSELELVAVGDWMAPVILDMQEDKQFSVSQLAGAENLYGFWKTISRADFNGDKQEDLILGNIGRTLSFCN